MAIAARVVLKLDPSPGVGGNGRITPSTPSCHLVA